MRNYSPSSLSESPNVTTPVKGRPPCRLVVPNGAECTTETDQRRTAATTKFWKLSGMIVTRQRWLLLRSAS